MPTWAKIAAAVAVLLVLIVVIMRASAKREQATPPAPGELGVGAPAQLYTAAPLPRPIQTHTPTTKAGKFGAW
jgi:hypothetical protein